MTPRTRLAAAALSAAALAVAAAALRQRASVPPAAPAPPPPPARAVPRGPPDRFGGPLVAAPLVSRGRRVASRPRGGAAVVDGLYRRAEPTWAGGHPTPEAPSFVAIDLEGGYSRLLVSFTSSGNHDYGDRRYGAPADYRLETSADSTDGEDGSWRTAVAVSGNPVRTRAHAIDFAGQRWLRLVVTGLSPDVFPWGLYLDEIDVHDLSGGGDDVWVFFGDSLTSAVFDRAPRHQPSFAEAIAARHPGHFPAMVDAGTGRLHHGDAVDRIDAVLALNPDARVVALSVGSNDWDPAAFGRDLRELVSRVRAAGKIPIVPRIPFRKDTPLDHAAALNRVVDEVTAELGLLPGPDLYGWFRAHPERLADGLHPDDEGSVQTNRLWAEAVAPLYR